MHDLLFGFEVDFLHRTVKYYLQSPDAQLMLETWSDEKFNADWEICTAFSALVKMAPRTSFAPESKSWKDVLLYFLIFASRLDQNPLCSAEIAYISDDLQRVILPAIRYYKEGLEEMHTEILLNAQPPKEGLDPDLYMICMHWLWIVKLRYEQIYNGLLTLP